MPIQHTSVNRRLLSQSFWIIFALFLIWDWQASPKPDLRKEPPAIALGSGQIILGGHCASPQ